MNAFVLSGAGNYGAAQAGAILALTEAGIAPHLVVGTSAGAINALYLSAFPSVEGARRLSAIWRGIRGEDVFPGNAASLLWRLSRHREGLYDPRGLERIVRKDLPYQRLEEARIPVVVVATELDTGRERWFDRGDAVRAVLASAAIPGVFPPVEIDGVRYIDGAVADRLPVAAALARGADRIYAIDVGFLCQCRRAYRSAMEIVMQAMAIMERRSAQLRLELEAGDRRADVVYVAVPCRVSLQLTDFSKTDQLIRDGYRAGRRTLERAARQAAFLGKPAPRPASSA